MRRRNGRLLSIACTCSALAVCLANATPRNCDPRSEMNISRPLLTQSLLLECCYCLPLREFMPVQNDGQIPRRCLYKPLCKRDAFVHNSFGRHNQLRPCGGASKSRLRPWGEPASTSMPRHVKEATSAMGEAFQHPASVSIWAEPADLMQLCRCR